MSLLQPGFLTSLFIYLFMSAWLCAPVLLFGIALSLFVLIITFHQALKNMGVNSSLEFIFLETELTKLSRVQVIKFDALPL